MNILIVGSGAREHAIAKALARSAQNPILYCCGNTLNPGVAMLTQDYWVGDINEGNSIVLLAKQWGITLAIIGPEAPLAAGIADALWAVGIPVVGPKKKLAQIESSKGFTRELMRQYGIAGLPKYQVFSSLDGVAEFLAELGEGHYVVKANGLMAGKGVKVAGEHLHSFEQALAYCSELFAQGQAVVIEEKLVGQEFSFMCFSDGKVLAPMPLVQDHKRAEEGDKGPNTGGMGSYSAANHLLPFLTADHRDQAMQINQAVVNALMAEVDEPYIGILYGGFMATAKGVYVIEFNARFGDPEALNVLSLLESDFATLCLALTQGHLAQTVVHFASKATVCKYAVPQGYPDHPVKNSPIQIDEVVDQEHLYLAAVHAVDGILLATGSRAAAYVGIGDTISEAEQRAEEEVSRIKGPLVHRKDIGTAALIEQRIAAMQALSSR